jgi:hypothetical protein
MPPLPRRRAYSRMSPLGTFPTWGDVRLESVLRTKADIGASRFIE